MDAHQLVDSLTAHISLYNSSIPSSSALALPAAPRSSILRWFSSLSVPQRQSALTVVDSNFLRILLQMQSLLRHKGHGFFLLLPDLPSTSSTSSTSSSLPSLIFRKSRGLLARSSAANEPERVLSLSLRLFFSSDDDAVAREFRSSPDELDACTVAEELVGDVERFVGVMDGVSGGMFLRGEERILGGDWFELGWLKTKGYYSLEAFVANKLEWAMRLSWMNSNGGKRRGGKAREEAGAAGVAANIFWRKKGCLDWWNGLETELKGKVLQTVLSKTAKSLAFETAKVPKDASNDGTRFFHVQAEQPIRYGSTMSYQETDADFESGFISTYLSGKRTSVASCFVRLMVLREISAVLTSSLHLKNGDKIFFSTLCSVNSVSDCVLRGVRRILGAISSDYLKLELFGEETSKVPQKKSKKKLKNKGRNVKRQSATEESLKNEKLLKENACEPGNYYCNGLNKSNMHIAVRVEEESKKADISEDISKKSLLLGSKKEPVHGIADDEAQRSAKKNGKENNKCKKSRIKEVSVDNGKWKAINSTLSITAECADRLLENSMSVLGFSGIASRDTSSGFSDIYAVNEPIKNDGSNSVMNVQDALVRAPSQSNNICEGKEADCHKLDLNSTGCPIVREAIVSHDADSILHGKEATGYYARGSPNPIGGLSYEWPSLGPVYFPSVYSPHLPLATDRLHLDVGHNWHSHLHQSFFTTRHQARNAVLENGWGQILPTGLDVTDDGDNSHWTVDEEADFHAFPGRDYNQFFGGGVMYWNPTDHGATSFSRPPSLSSEDSSWAWHEAELSRAVDEMVGFNYSANGLASPPAAPFCSPFDPVGPTQQPIGFVVPGNVATGNDVTGEDKVSGSLTNGGFVEGLTADSQPYPVLRPLIVPNISKRDSRSEYKLTHDRKSPCLPPTRHETPHIKRPPSPVILCVPQAPRPPPPCPVSDTRKQRGFPGARSGSSSPRNWGMRGWYHDGLHCEESRICADAPEVIWPSWRNKGLGPTKIAQTLPGSLLQDRLIAISQLAVDQEHPDLSLPLQPPNLQTSPSRELSLSVMHNVLHEEIDSFCKKVADVNLIKKPYINWAVKRVARSLQVLWPRSRTTIFGSSATGLALPSSDVDLVVCLPPVRNLEPIKEAGILEGRNGIKETCLQHAARYLGNQEWVKNDSLKTIENTAIPVLMLVAEVPYDLVNARGSSSTEIVSEIEKNDTLNDIDSLDHCGLVESGNNLWQMDAHTRDRDKTDVRLVRLDISFKSPAHTGLRTTELVRELTEQFPAVVPLALVLKQFLADRSLDHSYSGGLSSYCLVLLIIRFLQHEHHVGCSTKSLGSLLMDFLYFFGNVFDPRQMRISIQGTGVYVKRERGHSIDPLHIDDPLCPMNNVGRNCFRIHQCIKAFADAYSVLENELLHLPASNEDLNAKILFKFLPKIIPSIDNV